MTSLNHRIERVDRSASSRWGVPWPLIWVGLFGSTLAVVGGALAGAGGEATTDSSMPWSAPLLPLHPQWNAIASVAVYFAGLGLLVRSWLRLRRRSQEHPMRLAVAVIACVVWCLPLVLGPPLASRDVYSYVALGEAANTNIDPYVSSVDPPGGVAERSVDPIWAKGATSYGPLFTLLAKVAVAHAGPKLIAKTMAFRLLAVVSVLATGCGLVSIARRRGRSPAAVLVLALANPLVLLHFVSGAHNDILMIAFITVALAGAERPGRRWWIAAVVSMGLAAAVKAPGLIGIGYLAVTGPRDVVRRRSDLALAGVAGLGTVHFVGVVTGYGWSWARNLANGPGVLSYLSPATVFAVPIHWLSTTAHSGWTVTGIAGSLRLACMIMATVAAAWLIVHSRSRGISALSSALLVLALFGPAVQPWYLAWGLIIAAVGTTGRAGYLPTILTIAALFTVLPAGPDLGVVLIRLGSPLELAVVALALLPLTFRTRRRQTEHLSFAAASADVMVIIPTQNESDCIDPLLDRLEAALTGRVGEIVFVDDSDDSTPSTILSRSKKSIVPLRLLHRPAGRRLGGLSGAVVHGLAKAAGRSVVVMDADLQHPPEALPALLAAAERHPNAVIVGTRTPHAAANGLNRLRLMGSSAASTLARAIFPSRLRHVTDPMSGFFVVPSRLVDVARLNPSGFRILLELLVSHPDLCVIEVPYDFAPRDVGTSKAGLLEAMTYVAHLIDLRIRTLAPWRTHPGSPARPVVDVASVA